MNKHSTFYLIKLGQTCPALEWEDWSTIYRIKKLATKYQQQATNSCNGYGIVKGKMYYTGPIDDYAKREYGHNVQNGYVTNDLTIFDNELNRIRESIYKLINTLTIKCRVAIQNDPRGQCVKLFCNNTEILNLI